MHLLVILLLLVTVALLGGLGLLSSDTANAAATEGRSKGEVDVLLRVESDDERGHVDDLLADADVALADQNTGVVDRLGETELEDTGLEATLQEILNLQGQDVIELHAGLVEDTDADKSSNKGVAFEQTLGVLLVEGEKLTAGELAKSPLRKGKMLPTEQHDGSWTESNRLATPHACCAGHTLRRASTQSHYVIGQSLVTIDMNRDKL